MKKIKVLLLSGFLGAGKTTTALKLISHLQKKGLSAVYIANDQGKLLIDSDMGESQGIITRQVTDGCFCCKFDDLMDVIHDVIDEKKPDIIIAEAVGSCTDLVATVVRPFKDLYDNILEVMPFPVILDGSRYSDMQRLFGTRLSYLFSKQIEDAQIICLSKSDCIPKEEKEKLIRNLEYKYPDKPILSYSALIDTGIEKLAEKLIINPEISSLEEIPLDIDYNIYGAAEAEMAWVDLSLTINHNSKLFSPVCWINIFLNYLKSQHEIKEKVIGHIKISLSDLSVLAKASLVDIDNEITFDVYNDNPVDSCIALINARVEGIPQIVYKAIIESVNKTSVKIGTQTSITKHHAFSPAMPNPTHKILQI